MKKDSMILKLIIAICIGVTIGFLANENVMTAVVTVKYIVGQLVMFTIPLVIIGFIAPSIAKLQSNASKLLGVAIGLAYTSSVLAAFMSMVSGYIIIPLLNIQNSVQGLKEIPETFFELNIPPIMPVMSALVLALMLGVATSWSKAETFSKLLEDLQNIVLSIVTRIVIPILPVFVATTFSVLAYEGSLTKQVPIFIGVIAIVLVGHFIWITLLYVVAAIYSKKNSMEVLKHYGPAYLTAVGTMSSAATLPVSIESAKKSTILRKDCVDFGIPLFSNIHLCGSVLTEVFFVMVVSQMLYGKLPDITSMIIFVLLLGIFAIGAPGVPGGTVMASLGLIISVLGFNEAGTALMLTIFALQDSFGTACNVTGDGALTLMLSGYADKKKM